MQMTSNSYITDTHISTNSLASHFHSLRWAHSAAPTLGKWWHFRSEMFYAENDEDEYMREQEK